MSNGAETGLRHSARSGFAAHAKHFIVSIGLVNAPEGGILRRTRSVLAVLSLMLFLHDRPATAQSVEYFDQSTFAASAGAPTIATFDGLSACDNCLAGINSNVAGLGLTITQLAGLGVNVVQNTASPYGANFVTVANINSGPNAISSSIYTNTGDQSEDSFDFVFTSPVSAAGLFVGNLGNLGNTFTTTVSFLDVNGVTLASEVLDQQHAGVIPGSFVATVPWDVRVFCGITSTTLIKRIRVVNGPNDGDGITIDDVQFAGAAAVPTMPTVTLVTTSLMLLAVGMYALKRRVA